MSQNCMRCRGANRWVLPLLATSAAAQPRAGNGLLQAVQRAAYTLKDSGDGSFRGANPAQRLTLEFDEPEVKLKHPNGSVVVHLKGYGYGGRAARLERPRLIVNGPRVEYRRSDLTEWYENLPDGLEQGFTLAMRPGAGDESGPLILALDVEGLAPSQEPNGAVRFGSALRYSGLIAWDAGGRTLPSRMEVEDREIRLLVEDSGARYPLTIDPWVQQQELAAGDGLAGDEFGSSVSVSGNTAVIASPGKAAYVFVRSGASWGQQAELTPSDGAPAADYFGTSVALNGDTAVIGASAANNSQGAAFVFVRNGNTWSQQAELTANDGAAGDMFGASVSVSGDTAVIGATGNSFQGAAYVFVRSGTTWSQQQKLTASDGTPGDFFGISVSASADTVVIGADIKNNRQGAAYLFVRGGTAWSQQQKLTASDGAAGDLFGFSVSVSPDAALIGAPGNSSLKGAAYVFYASSGWTQSLTLTADDGTAGDYFGSSVSLSGGKPVNGPMAVIGARGKNNFQGVAYALQPLNPGAWEQSELTTSDGAAHDDFGYSVSMSGYTALIGAPDKNSLKGAAYAFVAPNIGAQNLPLGSGGGSSSILLSNPGENWTSMSEDSFLSVDNQFENSLGGVRFTWGGYTGTGARHGVLDIAGLSVFVEQADTNYLGPGPAFALFAVNSPAAVAIGFGHIIYAIDSAGSSITEWNTNQQTKSTVSSSSSYSFTGLATNGPSVFFADSNSRIQAFDVATQNTYTLVSSGLNSPTSLAADLAGNVYIADTGNHSIKEWHADTGQVTTLYRSATLQPTSVAVDAVGNVYFADSASDTVQVWNGGFQEPPFVFGLVQSGLSAPNSIAVDGSGNVYITEIGNNAIKMWNASTRSLTTLSSPGVTQPIGVAADAAGDLFIADSGNNAVEEVSNTFVGPPGMTEPAKAGGDALLPIVFDDSSRSRTGVFAPTSDQPWLTPGFASFGVFFDLTANPSTSPRTAHITILGRQITVTQNGLSPQTITFGPLANLRFGAAPFGVSATASSGLPVSFNSQTPAVCTVSGTTVTVVSVGTCTVQATQVGNDGYSAAAPVNQSFVCDLNADGVVNILDLQAIIYEALGAVHAADDLNQDHMVNVVDVEIVIQAALGLR